MSLLGGNHHYGHTCHSEMLSGRHVDVGRGREHHTTACYLIWLLGGLHIFFDTLSQFRSSWWTWHRSTTDHDWHLRLCSVIWNKDGFMLTCCTTSSSCYTHWLTWQQVHAVWECMAVTNNPLETIYLPPLFAFNMLAIAAQVTTFECWPIAHPVRWAELTV